MPLRGMEPAPEEDADRDAAPAEGQPPPSADGMVLSRTQSPRAAEALGLAGEEARKKDAALEQAAAEATLEEQLQRDIDAVQREIESATPRASAAPEPRALEEQTPEQLHLQALGAEESRLVELIASLQQQTSQAESVLQGVRSRMAELRHEQEQRARAEGEEGVPRGSDHRADRERVAGEPEAEEAKEDDDVDAQSATASMDGDSDHATDASSGSDDGDCESGDGSGSDGSSNSSSGSGSSSSDDDFGAPEPSIFNVRLVRAPGRRQPQPRTRLEVSARGLSIGRRLPGVTTGEPTEIEGWGWSHIKSWEKTPSGVNFNVTGIGTFAFGTVRAGAILGAVSQQIEYLVALRDANPEYKAQARRRQQAAQLAALGADQAEAEKAMAETGDFCVAASVLGIQNEVGRFVRSPVGLPNRSNDCFWLSTVQCLRHLPGFAQAVTGSVESALLRPPRNVAHALANLFLRMERQHEEQCLPLRDRSEFLTGIEPN